MRELERGSAGDAPRWRDRFLARPFARAALGTLFVLAGLAVFAPLLANDRPYVLDAIDRAGFEAARRTLPLAARELAELADGGAAGFALRRPHDDFEQHLRAQARAVEARVQTLASSLAAGDRRSLDTFAQALEHWGAAASARDAHAAEGRLLAERAEALSAELAPSDPGTAGRGVTLVGQVTYPLFESLDAIEVSAMVLWLALAAAFAAPRAARRTVRIAGCALAVLAFATWSAVGAPSFHSAASSIKLAATQGELDVRRAVFAPIPFGYAETNLSEASRSPTWLASSEPSRGELAHSDQGLQASAKRIEVRFGEPPVQAAWRHLAGTDSLGRDLAARCLWGARASLAIGGLSALFSSVIGGVLGAFAGWRRGAFDFVLARVIEVVQCFPSFFLVVLALSVTRPSGVSAAFAVALVIAFFGWTQVARLLRGEVLRVAELDFVIAARAIGASDSRIVFRHLLPNAVQPALVAAVFAAAGAIVLESSLSFLGLGVQEPIPSWGSVLGDTSSATHWWSAAAPGALIFATTLAVYRAGEALREALDPRAESDR